MLEQLHTPPEHSAEQRQRWHPYGAGLGRAQHQTQAMPGTAARSWRGKD